MISDRQERFEAWKKRDPEKYCFNHPNIHPANEKKIEWKEGATVSPIYIKTEKEIKKEVIEDRFQYCGVCLTTKVIK